MSDLPKIYATCKAGCQWETIHRSEAAESWYKTPVGVDGDTLTLSAKKPFSILVKSANSNLNTGYGFKIMPVYFGEIDGGSIVEEIPRGSFDIYKPELKLDFFAIEKTQNESGCNVYEFVCDVNGVRRRGRITCEFADAPDLNLDSFAIQITPITEAYWLNENSRYTVYAEDGYSPERGVDYWTEEDKAEIVNDVLSRLSYAEDGEY